ncbi:fluoride efflux transporter CrcB [Rubrobacter marinus]|uniref:Fluoride-specific ion channel FluC n=1 Tax=Rubrobacter marinus TaxID=2653852 RepID=A0A6G8PTA4_9ACTN|nr:fluoride efflux transporter CrcB [Rubrobacter marinus]QIN77738.1 fluoride efflux transporter CrcB [Rubrobacter marinus]
MYNLLLVAGGGALGAASRHLLGAWVLALLGPGFPWGTFLVNVSGSFLIGVVFGLVEIGGLPAGARPLLAIGVLGGYTTFSSFSYETLALISKGSYAPALFYSLAQVALGLAAVYAGMSLVTGAKGA